MTDRAEHGGERFVRVVGKRAPAPAGQPPSPEARSAMTRMADYRTRVPKGVFVYGSHEEANRARDAWQTDAMVAVAARR